MSQLNVVNIDSRLYSCLFSQLYFQIHASLLLFYGHCVMQLELGLSFKHGGRDNA